MTKGVSVAKEVAKNEFGEKECTYSIYGQNDGITSLSSKQAVFIYEQLKEYLKEENLIEA